MKTYIKYVLLGAGLSTLTPSCKQGNTEQLIHVLQDRKHEKTFQDLNQHFENRLFTSEEEVGEIHAYLQLQSPSYRDFSKPYFSATVQNPDFLIHLITERAHTNDYLFCFGNHSNFDTKNRLFFPYSAKKNVQLHDYPGIKKLFPELDGKATLNIIDDTLATTLGYEGFHNEIAILIANKNKNKSMIIANELAHECLIKKRYMNSIKNNKIITIAGYSGTGLMRNEFISNTASLHEDITQTIYQDFLLSIKFKLSSNKTSDYYKHYSVCAQVAESIINIYADPKDIKQKDILLSAFKQASGDEQAGREIANQLDILFTTMINTLTQKHKEEIINHYSETAKKLLIHRENQNQNQNQNQNH